MSRSHRSIYIVLLIGLIGSASPAAFARNVELVEEFVLVVGRVMRHLSDAKTIVDAAGALESIIKERAADECRDMPIPGMNDRQCIDAVSHVVSGCIDDAKQECPNFFSQGRMTCDIDCFGVMKALVEGADDQCRKGIAPQWLPCNAVTPQ